MTQHGFSDVPGKTHTHNATQIRVLCMYAVVYEASVVLSASGRKSLL